ncbi:hypothetical protein CYOC110262_15855 [Cytobacillus oceanisediminis]|uniref:Uncharacterized protein n=1 Tax=Cytobacillus oceanisediminis TaxID=665099 RepID=A0A562K6H9_9BACI|nr:hypothetical protein IQ19_00284 [Cytobacillus oceanisediminis]
MFLHNYSVSLEKFLLNSIASLVNPPRRFLLEFFHLTFYYTELFYDGFYKNIFVHYQYII